MQGWSVGMQGWSVGTFSLGASSIPADHGERRQSPPRPPQPSTGRPAIRSMVGCKLRMASVSR